MILRHCQLAVIFFAATLRLRRRHALCCLPPRYACRRYFTAIEICRRYDTLPRNMPAADAAIDAAPTPLRCHVAYAAAARLR